jgi:hypothetical protein
MEENLEIKTEGAKCDVISICPYYSTNMITLATKMDYCHTEDYIKCSKRDVVKEKEARDSGIGGGYKCN